MDRPNAGCVAGLRGAIFFNNIAPMHKASQLVCYIVSFLGAFFLGGFASFAFYQLQFHLEIGPGLKPIPIPTQFFIENNELPIYLTMIPWLMLVGIPLLPRQAIRSYWEPTSFLVRYVTFVTLEAFMVFVLSLSVALPFIELIKSVIERDRTPIELIFCVVFWILVVLMPVGFVFRIRKQKDSAQTERASKTVDLSN